jgi:hypothetical protein
VPDSAAGPERFGGRSHELAASVQRRWGRTFAAALRVRSNIGAREYRFEELSLRWRGVPLRRGSLRLALSDSWSPWRQLDRLRLDGTWSGPRHWSLAAGLAATVFDWQTSRDPQRRVRLQPRLSARWTRGSWSALVRVEETVDEFLHLRTGVSTGVTCRL